MKATIKVIDPAPCYSRPDYLVTDDSPYAIYCGQDRAEALKMLRKHGDADAEKSMRLAESQYTAAGGRGVSP